MRRLVVHAIVILLLLGALALGLLATVDSDWWFDSPESGLGDPDGGFVVAFFAFLWIAPIVVLSYLIVVIVCGVTGRGDRA